jgi:hypothetical protein
VRSDLETRFANTNAEITQALSEVDMYREMAQHDEAVLTLKFDFTTPIDKTDNLRMKQPV